MDRHHFLSALLLTIVVALPAQGAVDDARAKGLKWLVQTQKGDGSFSGLQGLEVQATAATVDALLAGGMSKSPQYGRALSWLANAPGSSVDARAWQAAALAAAGRDATAVAGTLRDERNTSAAKAGSISTGNTALWGPFPGYAASFPDTALAFGALRSAGVSYTNDTTELTVTVLCHTLPDQLTASPWNGSWPYALPQNGQPTHAVNGSLAATALTLFELKKQRQAGRFLSGSACSKTSPSAIDTAMASAKTWLIAQANADGGFAERNPQSGTLEVSSPTASALAVRALALFAAEGDSAATTAVTNARNWLADQQNPDGSWRGDPFVTARVLAAFPAAAGAQIADADNDGLPDVVEQQLGTQTAVADAQGSLATNGNAQAGLTATSFSAAGTLGQPFAYALSASGGTGPFTYARTGGALPPGLTLAANGQITGTPTSTGSYAFDYEVTDATGATTLVIGRIDVAEVVASSGGDADVPIPAWALLALGGALLTAIRRKAAC
ncbi:putative Ig domain-containing protein [Thauera sinica]|uniref:Ig domain-containing protein n=1 Tax=Thauera sinica TaxID=2665146 RepID=A0ABW1AUB2_9RHOO|nr:putative Ig domain-containing protein [Thauera sp. K11]